MFLRHPSTARCHGAALKERWLVRLYCNEVHRPAVAALLHHCLCRCQPFGLAFSHRNGDLHFRTGWRNGGDDLLSSRIQRRSRSIEDDPKRLLATYNYATAVYLWPERLH